MPPFIDLTGQRLGRWTVLSRSERMCGKSIMWWCQCECGTTREVAGGNLRRGGSISCGCWVRDRVSRQNGRKGSKRGINPETGLCPHPECTGFHSHEPRAILCPSVKEDKRLQQRRRTERLKEEGCCVKCGNPLDGSSSTLCVEHFLKAEVHHLKYRTQREDRKDLAKLQELENR